MALLGWMRWRPRVKSSGVRKTRAYTPALQLILIRLQRCYLTSRHLPCKTGNLRTWQRCRHWSLTDWGSQYPRSMLWGKSLAWGLVFLSKKQTITYASWMVLRTRSSAADTNTGTPPRTLLKLLWGSNEISNVPRGAFKASRVSKHTGLLHWGATECRE